MPTAHEIALRIIEAYHTGVGLAPVRGEVNGATVARGAVMQPRVEAEIAFVMKRDLAGSHITPEAVIAATDYVVPAIEICGSRIADHIEDTIADNASSGLVVVGDERRKPGCSTSLPGSPWRFAMTTRRRAQGVAPPASAIPRSLLPGSPRR
jgi:hypothetical protein